MKRAIIICLSALALVVFPACSKSEPTADANASATETVYTCPMHPQIRQEHPGNCPICGMKLVQEKAGGDHKPQELELSETARALADIKTTTVKRGPAMRNIDMFGVIAADDTRVATVTSRFPARIEKLFVNFEGTRVRKGEHLAEIYSDELIESQSELIGALRYDSNQTSAEGIKERLRLWDIPEDQIDLIDSTRKPVYRVRIDSPAGGVVTELNVKEGDYVQTGSRLFEVTDLNELWVYFDAYETDLPWLRYGQQVTIRAKAYPSEIFTGTIAFIQPMLDPETRTIKVRVNMANHDGKLRPGMFVRGHVEAQLGAGGQVVSPELAGKLICPMHPEVIADEPGDCPKCGMPLEPAQQLGYTPYEPGEDPLLVPASAVLRTGRRAVVYLAEGSGKFVGQEIELGPRAEENFVVLNGLRAGDVVVTNGAFRLDSELQIKARPSMMNPAEETAPSGMPTSEMPTVGDHPAMAQEPVDFYELHKTIPLQFKESEAFDTAINSALQSYFALKSNLDTNAFDLARANAATTQQRIQAIPMQGLSADAMPIFMELQARGLSGAQSLAADPQQDRANAVEAVSEAFIGMVQTFQWRGDEKLYLMYCPMAHGAVGARWLQTTPEVANPYFGPDMLNCGEVLAVWNPEKARWDDSE